MIHALASHQFTPTKSEKNRFEKPSGSLPMRILVYSGFACQPRCKQWGMRSLLPVHSPASPGNGKHHRSARFANATAAVGENRRSRSDGRLAR
jgi:hypothetical protein